MNIQFNYLYRDGGNNKIYGSQIFSNPDNRSLEDLDSRIRELLIDGQFFDPEKLEIEVLRFQDWDQELDHGWNEFEGLEETPQHGTVTINEFLKKLSKNASKINRFV